jgi:N-acetylneuraminic acid mutarotase
VFGGTNGSVAVNTMHVYDTVTGVWTRLANMPTADQRFGYATWNGKIYVIGGATTAGNVYFPNQDIYDIATDAWSVGAALPSARSDLRPVVYNDLIYAPGGDLGSSTSTDNLVYNPVLNT